MLAVKGILWQKYKLGLKSFIFHRKKTMVKVILPNSAPAGQGSPKCLENSATELVTSCLRFLSMKIQLLSPTV